MRPKPNVYAPSLRRPHDSDSPRRLPDKPNEPPTALAIWLGAASVFPRSAECTPGTGRVEMHSPSKPEAATAGAPTSTRGHFLKNFMTLAGVVSRSVDDAAAPFLSFVVDARRDVGFEEEVESPAPLPNLSKISFVPPADEASLS